MKKRNVELSLEKAKDWYKKGGELREIALQAFTESELTSKPSRLWKEYALKNGQISIGFGYDSNEYSICVVDKYMNATRALWKLLQLREEWVDCCGIEFTKKYAITTYQNRPMIMIMPSNDAFSDEYPLVFPTKEMAEDFLGCFRNLIQEAKVFL